MYFYVNVLCHKKNRKIIFLNLFDLYICTLRKQWFFVYNFIIYEYVWPIVVVCQTKTMKMEKMAIVYVFHTNGFESSSEEDT